MRLFGLFVILTLVLTACSTPQQEEKVITVGVLAPMSGPNALYGQAFVKGLERAVSEANRENERIRIIVEDHKGDPKEAVSAFQRIQLQNPDIIISSFSGPTLAVAPLVKETGKPLVISMVLATPNKDYDNSFRYFFVTEDNGRTVTEFFKEKGVKTVGLYYLNTESGKAATEPIARMVEEAGMQVVIKETFEQTATDHKTGLLKIAEKNPDAIYIFALRPDQVAPAVQENYDGIVMYSETTILSQLHKTSDAFEGSYHVVFPYGVPGTPENIVFAEKFGADENGYAAFGYDAGNAMVEALDTDGDVSQLVARMAAPSEYNGITGTAHVNGEARETSFDMQIVTIHNRTIVPVQ
jgi:branched-chain amino acid transport system substrate-binding protein